MKAVILAGGHGTRFWPVSRQSHPKQFLKISGSRTMLQETVDRVRSLLSSQDIYIVCSDQYVEEVRSQLPELETKQIIVEPLVRSTASCIGLAATYLKRYYPDEVMAVLPSDHLIGQVDEFIQVLEAAQELANQNWLVTFGMQPSHPATGYGYLLQGEAIGKFGGYSAYQVAQFIEKPDLEQAAQFLLKDNYYWNSGMFVWKIKSILEEINSCMPKLGQSLKEMDESWGNNERMLELFASLENISIDFGVMEKAKKVAFFPCDLGWNDMGSWKALEEISSQNSQGMSSNIPYVNIDGRDCFVHAAQEKVIALVGVENLLIIDTPDALLVCDRERAEDVKKVVDRLKDKKLKEYL